MRRFYHANTEQEMIGVKVRAVRELRSSQLSVPAGTILTIVGKYGGFELKSEPCTSCGVQVGFRKVPPDAVELVPLPKVKR